MFTEIYDKNGDAEDVFRDRISANFEDLYTIVGRRMPTEIFTVGDSLANQNGNLVDRSALAWALMMHRPDVFFDYRYGNRGVGTSISGKNEGQTPDRSQYGMTSKYRMDGDIAAFRACINERGRQVHALMFIGTNDSFLQSDNGQGDTESTVANVRLWYNTMRAAGCLHYLTMIPPGPGSGAGDTPVRVQGLSNALEAFANENPGRVHCVKTVGILSRDTIENRALGTAGQVGGVHYDELHPAGNGQHKIGDYGLGPLLVEMHGRIPTQFESRGDVYDPQFNIRGSILGGLTRYGGTGSTAANHDVTLDGNPSEVIDPQNFPAGRGIQARLTGTQRIACSVVTDPLFAAIGRDDVKATAIRLSGTPTGEWTIAIGGSVQLPAGFDPTKMPFVGQGRIYVDATHIKMPSFNWTYGGFGGQSNTGADVIPHLKGMLYLESRVPMVVNDSYGNISSTFATSGVGGYETAGDIIICSGAVRRHVAVPPATV